MKKLYFLFFILITCSLSYGQVINEVDADTPGTDTAEFVEIFWTPNTALDNLSVVFFNGNGDTAYAVFDLDGLSTDADGFFILANSGLAGDIDLGASNQLQNGADAVALYSGDFISGDAVTATNLISGVVYDTNDNDDMELLTAISGIQYNEDENGAKDTQSVQRNTDGTYTVKNITFRASNDAAVCDLSLGGISATCDAVTAGTDTYTATLDFSGGGTSTYTVTTDSGTVDLTMGDPSVDASGTITITGINEGTDVTITIQDGALCDLSSMITSVDCIPSLDLPIYEDFDYTVGAGLGDQPNWENSNSGDDVIIGGPGGLTYPNFANTSQSGNHITFDANGIDPFIEFTDVTSGSIYTSFLMNVSNNDAASSSGYFAVLGGFDVRLWTVPNGNMGEYQLGISNVNTVPSGTALDSTVLTTGSTVLVILSYNTANGVINLWVNPSDTTFGASEPAATATETDPTVNPIGQFLIRQDSASETPFILFDELRIANTYADVTPQTLSNVENNLDRVSFYPNPTDTGFVNITSTNNALINVQVFDILGKQVKNETLSNNTLNVSDLNTGIYIVKIAQNNALITKKLVIK